MKAAESKSGIFLPVLAIFCVVAIPIIVISAFSSRSEGAGEKIIEPQSLDFDHRGDSLFKSRDELAPEYMKGSSTHRTLPDYYSLRQYHGSPPYIPHDITEKKIENVNCLSCHEKGGWSHEFKLNTPLTPHPDQINCIQCHMKTQEITLFKETDWISNKPPVLGRSYLPGAPVPVPHSLQGRGNCIACHVGPGAIDAIRSDHPDRGNCRQCHLADMTQSILSSGIER
jgi:cytochrome c-type protein NapB